MNNISTMSKLSFYQPFANVSIILFHNNIAGKLVLNKNNELITLDIEGHYFHKLQDSIMNQILFYLGCDYIMLNTIHKYEDYYEELGFTRSKNIENQCIQMKYKK